MADEIRERWYDPRTQWNDFAARVDSQFRPAADAFDAELVPSALAGVVSTLSPVNEDRFWRVMKDTLGDRVDQSSLRVRLQQGPQFWVAAVELVDTLEAVPAGQLREISAGPIAEIPIDHLLQPD
ncbi:MAG: hypothetical protein ACREN2_02195 [Candidatus Dormibacteria bacterium]